MQKEIVAYGVFNKYGDLLYLSASKEVADLIKKWQGDSIKPLYAEPLDTDPYVAVKKLEWSGNIAHTPFGAYSIDESVQPDAEEAKALVQADFEARIRSALVECETYFEARADADCDQDGFIPNEEMRILVEVKEALSCRQLNSFFAGRSAPSKKETQEGAGDIVEELKDEAVRLSIEKGGDSVSSRDVTDSIIFKGAREIERLRQLLSDAGNREQVANAVEQERLRFEGDLDKWMKIIGAGITGYQPEAYAVMDLACIELVKLRAMLAFLNDNVALELVWQEVNGDPSECGWHLFRRFGGRSDRDFKVVGTGETVEKAIAGAMDLGMLAAAPAYSASKHGDAE